MRVTTFRSWFFLGLLFFLRSCPFPCPAQPIMIANSTPEKALTASNLVNVLNTNFARLYGQFSGTTDRTNGTSTNTLTLAGTNRVKAAGTVLYRSLEERLAEVGNARDYGARGDGVTDDTAALQSWIASGRNLFLPAGTYCLSAQLV